MITVKNTQRKIPVDTKRIIKTAQTILDQLKYPDFDLGIWLTTNKTIHRFNKEYREKDKPTDILSFAYHQLEPGQRIIIENEEDKNLGDLIISVEFVQKLLPLYNTTLAERLDILLVHGICHLLGYSHYDQDNDKIMSALEKKLTQKLKIKNSQTSFSRSL